MKSFSGQGSSSYDPNILIGTTNEMFAFSLIPHASSCQETQPNGQPTFSLFVSLYLSHTHTQTAIADSFSFPARDHFC